MALTAEQVEKLQASMAAAEAARKRQRERKKEQKKAQRTRAQRKIPAEFTGKQVKELNFLQQQVAESIQNSSFITPARQTERVTKKDLKKGRNGNLGIDGLIGEVTQKNTLKKGEELVKWAHRNFGIEHLRDLKPHMVQSYLDEKVDNGHWTPKTLKTYLSTLRKFAECNVRLGIESHKNLLNDYHEAVKKRHQDTGVKTRGRKADGSSMTLRDAQVLAKHAEKIGSPLESAMLRVLISGCPRADELLKIKFSDIDFENCKIDLTQKNLAKNGRPRHINIDEATTQQLKDLWDTGLFKNPRQNIFGSHFGSQDNVRAFVKDCARSGKVAYLGVHAFRNASKEFWTKELEKKGKTMDKTAFKEFLANKILDFVAADPQLNPMVPKKEAKTDGNGKILRNPKGFRILQSVPGEFEPKFTYEKLLKDSPEKLIKSFLSQQFGHNRRNVIDQY